MTVKKTSEAKHETHGQGEPINEDKQGLDRLIFFSDGVFAIAVTLLALEIRLPPGAELLDSAQLLTALVNNWHQYLAYLISFLVIGSFWISHHRKFRYIRRYDGQLIFLNLICLMVVAFMPFPSSVISVNSSTSATVFYALIMVISSLLFTLIWWHASRHNRLIKANLTPHQRRREFLTPLTTAAIFLISIGVAFFDAGIARFIWLLILPASMLASGQ